MIGRRPWLLCVLTPAALGAGAYAQSPFAARVVEYASAPGQFVTDPSFNDPDAALGPPSSAGETAPSNVGLVSLGGFGGSITLAFDHTVLDDPRNPLGLDAIVFGNAHWVAGDPNARWAEPATIEISLDVNLNGIADDPWYLIRGSHITDPIAQFASQTWDTDTNDTTFPPHLASWIPASASPDAQGRFETVGWVLPSDPFDVGLFLLNSSDAASLGMESVWGYAECSPTRLLGDLDGDGVTDDTQIPPERFYTRPDDPLTIGIDPGAGGGDAFDIAWAIDPLTGAPAALPGFDFIRLTSARRWSVTILGEPSSEIDAVADVTPTPGATHGAATGGFKNAVRMWRR